MSRENTNGPVRFATQQSLNQYGWSVCRIPAELIALIEAKDREVAEALAELKRW